MATQTFTKYSMIQVGDRIVFPNSMALIKGGVITRIKGLNQHHKEIWTENGGHFIASKYEPNKYEIFREIERD